MMRKILALLSLLIALPASAQQFTRSMLYQQNNNSFFNNSSGFVKPQTVNNMNQSMIQSFGVVADGNIWTGSNTFTGPLTLPGVIVFGSPLAVSSGGTGSSVFTANGVLYGNGSGAVQSTGQGTSGQVLTAVTNGAPYWASGVASGVTSLSFGATGLTPATPSTGAIVVGGALGVANGGTGQATLTSGVPLLGNGTGAVAFGTVSGHTTAFTTQDGSAPVATHCAAWDTYGGLVDTGSGCGVSGTITVPGGGTGQTTFTANLPILGNGASALTQGTIAGNTTKFATVNGSLTPTYCLAADANGNVVSAAGTCSTGGGGGTVASGNQYAVAYYPSLGTTVQGLTVGTTGQVLAGATGAAPAFTALSGLAVTSLSGGTTGLTPSVATQGAITLAGTLGVANGGTGATTLTANLPLIGNGTGAVAQGTVTGNTTKFATASGALTSTYCLAADTNGNVTSAGGPCSTLNPSTIGYLAYYTGATTLSGSALTAANLTALGVASGAGAVVLNGGALGTPSSGSAANLTSIPMGNASGVLGVANGGTGAATLTIGVPILGNGTGAVTSGTVAGNTTKFATVNGSLTPTYCLAADANGNVVSAAGTCSTGGGGGTVSSGNQYALAYYPSLGTTVQGLSAAGTTGQVLIGNTGAAPSFSSTLSSISIGAGSSITSSGPGGALASGAYAAAYTLPAATSSTLGGVKPDGVTLSNSTGAIAVNLGNANTWTATQTFPAGSLTLAEQATQAANTVVGNATASPASPTALVLPSCSGASNALTWTLASGFGCNTITASGLALPTTVSGTVTSGGIPYFSSTTNMATSAVLASGALVVGGGAGAAPATTTTGTGVVTALGVNPGSVGSVVVNGGTLGEPSSGNASFITNIPMGSAIGTLAVANGGTGAGTFVAGRPLLGNTISTFTQGTVSGNTTAFMTADGALTSSHCPQIDAFGGLVDSGAACGSAYTVTCGNTSADQTTLQNALNAGGRVTVAPGTCQITGLVITVNNTSLIGAGMATTILRDSSATGNAITIGTSSQTGADPQNIMLSSFGINSSVSRTAGAGIYKYGSNRVFMEFLDIEAMYNGIVLDGSCGGASINCDYNTYVTNSYIENNSEYGIQVGVYASGTTSVNFPQNIFLQNLDVKEGDVIVSSGMGGVFPKGLLIGQVSHVDRQDDGLFLKINVAPFVDFSKLEEILILVSEENKIK